MKVIFNGGTIKESGKVEEMMSEVINEMCSRIGIPEGTAIEIEGLEFKVVFNIDGEKRYATVDREINGETVNEMFMVSVHIGEDGEITQKEDNEEESFFDGYSLAKANGQEYNYEGIVSPYADTELEVIDSIGENTSEDVMAVRYKILGVPELELVRHYKGDKLVAEYEYIVTPEVEAEEAGIDTEATPDNVVEVDFSSAAVTGSEESLKEVGIDVE